MLVVLRQAGRCDVEGRFQVLANLLECFGAAELVEKVEQLQVRQGRAVAVVGDMRLQQFDGFVVFANRGVKLGLFLGVQKVLRGHGEVGRGGAFLVVFQVVVRLGQHKTVGFGSGNILGRFFGRRGCLGLPGLYGRGGRGGNHGSGRWGRRRWWDLCAAQDGLHPPVLCPSLFYPQAVEQIGNDQQRCCQGRQEQV